MELRHYLDLFRKWIWLIVVGGLLAAGAAFLVSKTSTPIYRATATLLVNQSSSSTLTTDYTSLLTSQQLAKTYSELLQRRPTLEAVIRNLKLNTTPQALLAQVDVNPVRDTTLISVSVEDADPARAAAIANEIGKVFVDQITQMQRSRFSSSEENLSSQLKVLQTEIATTQQALDTARKASPPRPDEVGRLESSLAQYQNSYANLLKSYEDLRVAQTRLTDSVSIAETAIVPNQPVRPQVLQNTLLAAIVGILLASGLAFVIEYLDDTVKTSGDVTELNVTNLGVIARIDEEEIEDKLVVIKDARSPTAEAFRALRTNIQFASVDRPLRVLLITSTGPGEGKSTIAVNLAAALAQSGQSVALVDGDLRRPMIHRFFKMSNNVGLTTSLIQDGGTINGSLRPTPVEGLEVMASGALPPNPAELLGSDRTAHLLEALKDRVDIVVVDTPPCLVVTDAVSLSKRADGVLVVVETGKTRRSALEQTLRTLQQVNAPILGTVLNKQSLRGRGAYYNYYDYYYYSSDSSKHNHRNQNGALGWFSRLFDRFNRSNGQVKTDSNEVPVKSNSESDPGNDEGSVKRKRLLAGK